MPCTRRTLLALVAMLTCPGLGWGQAPERPAAYVLPPADVMPEIRPIVAPFVDDSPVGRPGFFTDLQLFVVQARLSGVLSGNANATDTVTLPFSGNFGTSVSPWVSIGYRMPEQLGEFSVAYRFEGEERSLIPFDSFGGIDERDRLSLNLIDLDWAHASPFALPEGWNLRFNIGVRVGLIYLDSQRTFMAPGNTSGQLSERASSFLWGVGPEAGFEVSRQVLVPGLAIFTRVSGASLFADISQTYSETTAGGNSSSSALFQVAAPMLTVQVGVTYSPPTWNGCHFMLGYVWEEFWDIGRLNNSNAELNNQGLFFRTTISF